MSLDTDCFLGCQVINHVGSLKIKFYESTVAVAVPQIDVDPFIFPQPPKIDDKKALLLLSEFECQKSATI